MCFCLVFNRDSLNQKIREAIGSSPSAVLDNNAVDRMIEHHLGLAKFYIDGNERDSLCNLYRILKDYPKSSTLRALAAAKVAVDGPFSPEGSNKVNFFLCNVIDTGEPKILKQARRNEIEVVKNLHLRSFSDSRHLVPAELLEVEVVAAPATSPFISTPTQPVSHPFTAILMPRYVSSLDTHTVVLTPDSFLQHLAQIVDAVSFLHQFDYVHEDIKPDNIFLCADGSWWLGDFDSAVRVSTSLLGVTELYRESPPKSPAQFAHDWWCLAITAIVLLDPIKWKDNILQKKPAFSNREYVDIESVHKFIASVQHEQLRHCLDRLLVCSAPAFSFEFVFSEGILR